MRRSESLKSDGIRDHRERSDLLKAHQRASCGLAGRSSAGRTVVMIGWWRWQPMLARSLFHRFAILTI
jgi:hypothetical protein